MKIVFLILLIIMAICIFAFNQDAGFVIGGNDKVLFNDNKVLFNDNKVLFNNNKVLPNKDILSDETIFKIRDFTRKQNNFGPITEPEFSALTASFPDIDKYDLLQIRNLETTISACKSGVRAMQNEPKIKQLYSKGVDVLSIAKKLHLPPAAVSKQLGIPLTESVRSHDLSAINTMKYSAAYERFVESKLKGIKFKTEEMIRAERTEQLNQIDNQSKSLLTPDFLLEKPVMFRGNKIYWIDAKHYPLYRASFHSKLINQVKKYNTAFGPGLLVFSRIIQPVELDCYLMEMRADNSMLIGSDASREI